MMLARQTRYSPRLTSTSRTFGTRWIYHILLRRSFWRRSWQWRRFCTLITIVPETAFVPFQTLPVGFPLPTFSLSFMNATLSPFVLDQNVRLKCPISSSKFRDLKVNDQMRKRQKRSSMNVTETTKNIL